MRALICFLVVFPIFISTLCLADECMEGDCENGVGTGFTEEGKIYQGQWQDGLPHGTGKLTKSRGKYIEGVWDKGELKEASTR